MKFSTGLLAILLLGAAGTASAEHWTADRQAGDRGHDGLRDQPRAAAQTAPEIGAGSLVAALTLLGGSLILLRTRRGVRKDDRA